MKILRVLFSLALLILVPFSYAQTQIPVVNPSFEQGFAASGNGAGGPWSYQTPTGWTKSGGGNSGLWQPDTSGCGYKSIPDGTTVVWNDGVTISQDLQQPALASQIYLVTVWVGHRNCEPPNSYTITLLAGTTPLCTWVGSNSTIPVGTFAAQINTCQTTATPPSGDLTISLSSNGVEVEFDDVSISATPLVAPVQNSITVNISVTFDDGSIPTIYTVNVNDVTDPKNTIGQLSLTPDPVTGVASGQFNLISTKQYQVALLAMGAVAEQTFYDGGLVLTIMPKISQTKFTIVLSKANSTVVSFDSSAQ
jgi:hypothetical protein